MDADQHWAEVMVLRLIVLQGVPLCQMATPAFVSVSSQEEAGLDFFFSKRLTLPASGQLHDEGHQISLQCLSPLRRLHGGGCQREAKQIRSRNDVPVFPCCTRSMGQIGSCVCLHKGTQSELWHLSATPTWTVQLKIKRYESQFLIMSYVDMPVLSGAFFFIALLLLL